MVNRLVIKNIPTTTTQQQDSRYKFKVYIKRTPYSAAVSYINIEELEIENGSPTNTIIPLNKCGSSTTKNICIKPSVNSSFIIQEFNIFYVNPEICAYQTIYEI